jgi:hypothetical protein
MDLPADSVPCQSGFWIKGAFLGSRNNQRFQSISLPCVSVQLRYSFGTTSVQLSERKTSMLLPKRHQIKHLKFVISWFGTRGSDCIHFFQPTIRMFLASANSEHKDREGHRPKPGAQVHAAQPESIPKIIPAKWVAFPRNKSAGRTRRARTWGPQALD